MKRVFVSDNSAEVGLLKTILEEAGIASLIRNETQAYQSVIPTELWVLNTEDYDKALALCRNWRNPLPVSTESWVCRQCGESIEGQFDSCWKCGASRDSSLLPAIEGSPPPPADSPSQPTDSYLDEARPHAQEVSPNYKLITVLIAVAAVVAASYRHRGYISPTPGSLYYPVHTALWLVDGEMRRYEALRHPSPINAAMLTWQRAAVRGTPRFCKIVLDDTIAFAEKRAFPANEIDELRATLAVVLAETGNAQRREKYLGALAVGSTNIAGYAPAIRPLFQSHGQSAFTLKGELFEVFPNSWAEQTLKRLYLSALGDLQEARSIESSISATNQMLADRYLVIAWTMTLLQIVGLALLALLWRRGGLRSSGINPQVAIPWSGWRGVSVLFASYLCGIAVELFAASVGALSQIAYSSFNLLVWSPLFVWLAFQWTFREAPAIRPLFSLRPFKQRGKFLIVTGLAFFALESAALIWIESTANAVGLHGHWIEGLNEAENFAPWPAKGLHLLNGILWAPIGEELAFRGVLFLALKSWMRTSEAALLSAVAFGAMHFYSWPAFLGVTAFGFLSAIAVQKSQSLVPSIIAHILTNLIWVGGSVWIYSS